MTEASWERVAVIASRVLGWAYFFAWTLSFFPQPILNFKRKTTAGMMPDFPLLNVVGFSCYTVSTTLFLFSPTIKKQYAARHMFSPEPTVRGNDLAFGAIGLSMSIVTYSQLWPRLWRWRHRSGVKRHATKITLGLICGSLLALLVVMSIVWSKGDAENGMSWAWIDVVYAMEYIKLVMTFFKYVPQVIANFRRRSTIGWSIAQQLMDFAGGIGSLLQLVIDSSLQNDWSGLTGNPLKFGLANISLVFDIMFIVQHFILFGPVEEKSETQKDNLLKYSGEDEGPMRDEREPLIARTRM